MKRTKQTPSKKALRDFCRAAVATGVLDLKKDLVKAAETGRSDVVQALIDGGPIFMPKMTQP